MIKDCAQSLTRGTSKSHPHGILPKIILPTISTSTLCQVGVAPPEGAQALAALAAFKRSGLLGPAGVATTNTTTGQQWDAPNAWPPLQDIVIEALENYGGETPLS